MTPPSCANFSKLQTVLQIPHTIFRTYSLGREGVYYTNVTLIGYYELVDIVLPVET